VLLRRYAADGATFKDTPLTFVDRLYQVHDFDVAPDGARAAFVARGAGDVDVFTLDLRSGAGTRLTNTREEERRARWSPDGTTLACLVRTASTCEEDRKKADAAARKLNSDRMRAQFAKIQEAGRKHVKELQACKTDAERRAATARWNKQQEAMRAEMLAGVPRTQPQRGRLPPREIYALYTIPADGKPARKILGGSVSVDSPVWSPDGRRLACAVGLRDAWAIAVVDVATGERTDVVPAGGRNRSPRWSPDGRQILFIADRDGHPELCLAPAST
jgi:dipeptidyl aminopeptidase/acylaminoacyl peptidase